MRQSNQKLKLLYLMRLFQEETDDKNGLTMPQIIEALEEWGISAERKAIYRDIEALQEYGLDIRKLKRAPVQYALVKRDFSAAELMMLADTVQSSHCLTQSKSDHLVNVIKTLGSRSQAKNLHRRMHVGGRIKMQNESVFNNIDSIQEAISAKRKITFYYVKYDLHKNQVLQHNGEIYCETPVYLMYVDSFYYVVTYSDHYEHFTHFRVDRMQDIQVTDQSATKNPEIANFDPAEYERQLFGMYGGEPQSLVLTVEEHAMSNVIDRFGKEVTVTKIEDKQAFVHVTVIESPVFYGWLSQFGGAVRIASPAASAKAYKEYIAGLLEACN